MLSDEFTDVAVITTHVQSVKIKFVCRILKHIKFEENAKFFKQMFCKFQLITAKFAIKASDSN